MIFFEYKSESLNEWMLIETQGHVEYPKPSTLQDDGDDEALSEQIQLGKLTLQGGDKAQLIIGNHILHGRVVPLKKPLILLQKIPTDEGHLSYTTQSIIKNKILFKNRPSVVA